MKKGELLNEMLLICVTGHAGQYDKAGNPYILHVLKVMHKLRSEDEELNCIALGHDVIEDYKHTQVTYAMLLRKGMTQRVIDGIRCLTKVPGETQEEYELKVLSNIDAIRVKLKDLEHNSDIRRLKGLSDKDFERLRKYNAMYMRLKLALEEYERHR